VFTSIDGFAHLRAFETKALSGGAVATPGAYLDITAPVAIEAAIGAPDGTTLEVFRDGDLLYETQAPVLRIDVGSHPGAYHVEARLPWQQRGAIPWLMTNPIYVGLREAHARASAATARAAAVTRTPIATNAWEAEASSGSSSDLLTTTLEDGTPAIAWQFTLAGGVRGGQYAAMRFPVGTGVGAHDRLQLRARSAQPLRVWAQLRAPGTKGPERWGKSFYVGPGLDEIELRFEDFQPFESWSEASAPLQRVDSILLVIDMVNSDPGSTGRVAITDLWLAR
jgi:hypothetical protein